MKLITPRRRMLLLGSIAAVLAAAVAGCQNAGTPMEVVAPEAKPRFESGLGWFGSGGVVSIPPEGAETTAFDTDSTSQRGLGWFGSGGD